MCCFHTQGSGGRSKQIIHGHAAAIVARVSRMGMAFPNLGTTLPCLYSGLHAACQACASPTEPEEVRE